MDYPITMPADALILIAIALVMACMLFGRACYGLGWQHGSIGYRASTGQGYFHDDP